MTLSGNKFVLYCRKMMKTIMLMSIILATSMANAVCLEGHHSIEKEYAGSQSIIIGKVTRQKDIPESGNYYDGNNYTVQVQDVLKGNPTSTIVIFSENSTSRFPMSVGNTYILFVHYELGHYQVDNCGNSGLLSENQAVVQAVRLLKQY